MPEVYPSPQLYSFELRMSRQDQLTEAKGRSRKEARACTDNHGSTHSSHYSVNIASRGGLVHSRKTSPVPQLLCAGQRASELAALKICTLSPFPAGFILGGD